MCVYAHTHNGIGDFLIARLVKESTCNRRPQLDSWVRKVPWRRERLLTPVFWPGEVHGLYCPWGHKEWNTTEQLSLNGIGIIKKNWIFLQQHGWIWSVLCEVIRGKKTNIVYYLYVKSKKYSKLVNITKKKLTHRCREQTSGYGGEGREAVPEWGVGGRNCWCMILFNMGDIANIL